MFITDSYSLMHEEETNGMKEGIGMKKGGGGEVGAFPFS